MSKNSIVELSEDDVKITLVREEYTHETMYVIWFGNRFIWQTLNRDHAMSCFHGACMVARMKTSV